MSNYLNIYKDAFNVVHYSADHHIQYNYILDVVLKYNNINNSIIDIGSGRGHLIRMLNIHKEKLLNYSLTSVDLDKFHNELCDTFIKCDLSQEKDRLQLLEKKYDILICTDVFEHLDKSFIENVIHMCSKLSQKCIFGIANHSDILNNVELHTIQENDIWWENILNKYFNIIKKDVYYGDKLYMYVCETI
jgi:2-polyprenyl-3-methyl-5-hydroxy-6-metoxy-1,4-benzoquinol methylase